MNLPKKILSYLLLFIYVLSGAHGAISHCHDSNHGHAEHNHEHQSHDHEGNYSSQLQSVSHDIYHSVVHFIEHLAHDHECCFKELVTVTNKAKQSKKVKSSVVGIWGQKLRFPQSLAICLQDNLVDICSNIYLSTSFLRGPPSIV